LYSTVQYSTVQCVAGLVSVCNMLCTDCVQYSTVQYSTVQCVSGLVSVCNMLCTDCVQYSTVCDWPSVCM